MRLTILNTQPDHYPPEAKAALSAAADFDDRAVTQSELPDIVGSYDIILMGLGFTWDRSVLERAKNLKLLVTASTGLDHIDTAYLAERGIPLLSLKGERALLDSVTSTAELAFALLLALARNLPQAIDHVKAGGWKREEYKGHELSGKTLGIVGYGRLGKIMGRQAKGFSMRVIAADPNRTEEELAADGVEHVSLEDLCAHADAISIHAPLEQSTVGLIGRKEFSLMKRSAYFINTARGKLADEAALLDALRTGKIAGAGLDVVGDEVEFTLRGEVASPLIEYAKTHPNCIIVPHVGGTTYEAIYKTREFLTKKVLAFIKGA